MASPVPSTDTLYRPPYAETKDAAARVRKLRTGLKTCDNNDVVNGVAQSCCLDLSLALFLVLLVFNSANARRVRGRGRAPLTL